MFPSFKLSVLAALLGSALSAPLVSAASRQTQTSTVCPSVYQPVCGTDGKTYGNSCMARKANVQVARSGSCGGSRSRSRTGSLNGCSCALDYNPVCDTSGRTHQNVCTMKCKKATLAYNGVCRSSRTTSGSTSSSSSSSSSSSRSPRSSSSSSSSSTSPGSSRTATSSGSACSCPKEYSPVCGTNNHTYHNDCLLNCKGATLNYKGACPVRSACTCIDHNDPVCDTKGKTHLNECVMKCKGGTLASQGVCRSSSTGSNLARTGGITRTRTTTNRSRSGTTSSNGNITRTGSNGSSARPASSRSSRSSSNGSSSASCNCPNTVDPVCDTNNVTHRNSCIMQCRGGTLAQKGSCESRRGCQCPNTYQPACDSTGRTHFNKCLLQCKGAVFAYDGRCSTN